MVNKECRSIHFIGAVYIDTILTVPNYPSEDEKLRATTLTRRLGGNVANTAGVLAQLTADSAPSLTLLAPLPEQQSAAFAFVRDTLSPRVLLPTTFCRKGTTEAASSYIIKSTATGSRTIVNFNDLEEMRFDEFREIADRLEGTVGERDLDGAWWHFEGRIPDVTLQCLQYLRAQHPRARLSVEVEKPGRRGLQELAQEADVVFYSKSWASSEGFHSPEPFLREQARIARRASLLCCTWGRDGAGALKIEAGKTTYQGYPASNGIPTVDSIGAGDTFIAGMLYGLTKNPRDWGFQQTLAFAVELAGQKVRQEGFEGLREKVSHYLASRPAMD